MNEEERAKARQGYIPNPKPRTCQNCKHFQFEGDTVQTVSLGGMVVRRNPRCGLGDFPVWATATCNEYGEKA